MMLSICLSVCLLVRLSPRLFRVAAAIICFLHLFPPHEKLTIPRETYGCVHKRIALIIIIMRGLLLLQYLLLVKSTD